ncbi:MAG: hypothetical protein EXR70_12925 [Deltaproteobacteria bacterium]|nr:hypothetical protein [Deltaproteobacteria bacterium]
MAIRYATIVLTAAGSLALVLGLLLWGGLGMNLISLHMLLGFLAVGALWIVAVGQALGKNGNWPIAIAALLLGGLTIWLGTTQTTLMSGDRHWIVQVIHLLLGVALIGLGHVGAARQRRASVL